MKYMILIHSNPSLWQSLPKEEADRVLGNHYKLIEETKQSGELVRVEGLGWDQTFVQFQNGVPAVTDGPYGEVKELLGRTLRGRRREPRPGDRDRRADRPSTAGSRSGRVMDDAGTEDVTG